jgi:hypothetical protein
MPHDSPRSSIQILIAFFASLIFIHESDIISGELGGFHCSSIGSIVILTRVVMLVEVMVLMKKIVEKMIVLMP